MDETRLLNLLEDPLFVQEIVKAESEEDLSSLLSEHNIIVSDEEVEELKKMIKSIKNSLLETRRVNKDYLEEISGGKPEFVRKIVKPVYYTGYGLGYVAGKTPIIGYTVYHSIKDAIRGFYEAISSS